MHDCADEGGGAPGATERIRVTAPDCRWVLEVQDDQGGRRVPLTGRTTIGSSGEVHLRVNDPTVSARHAVLDVFGGGLLLEDLGSRNGTFVGAARVMQAWVTAGATITLGRASIVCVAVVDDEARARAHDAEVPLPGLAGASVAMRRLASQVRRLARHAAPVLVSGESGTGKELVARALHREGPRREGPFVVINVAALPRDLVEAELFGHERGAFTGATERRAGKFEEAEGGTLFLDEVGELPLDAQPKLLRALDGYEVRRIGASGSGKRTDVRVVAATHVPLEDRVARGLFRRDLFHRLEVFVVALPPLRARPGDIGPIARELLARAAREIGRRDLSAAAVARLAAHDWPGNVRELRNVLYRAADDVKVGAAIDAAHVHAANHRTDGQAPPVTLTAQAARACFAEHHGNLSAAARAAGLPRTSFRKLLQD
jgi:DNA-binding NtrC family response regulator